MDQEMLKTSKKQRLIIAVIAILMIGSFIASYAGVILSKSDSAASDTDALVEKYASEYYDVQKKVASATASEFDEFIGFKNRIVAYNENTANENGLQTEDLKIGDGRTLAEGDTNYLAFYVGWCPDESIFDSTFNSNDSPASFTGILDASVGLIEGWNAGVIGMNLGGIREITIPGELAYQDTTEICGGTYKPLKFLVMPVENSGSFAELYSELNLARTKYQYASWGIDYDKQIKSSEESSDEPAEPAAED